MKGIPTGSTPDGHEAMEEEKVRTKLLIPSQKPGMNRLPVLILLVELVRGGNIGCADVKAGSIAGEEDSFCLQTSR